jgi:hypothetical protein
MKTMTRLSSGIAIISIALLVSGCAAGAAKMCRTGALAKPEMQVNYQSHERIIDDHVYFSKEAASGGRGFGGGGCGCN